MKRVTSDIQTITVLKWLYNDSSVFLDRKLNKYLEFEKELKKRGLVND